MLRHVPNGESKIERLCRGNGGEGRGVEYATERHIFTFVEMKVLKLFFFKSSIHVKARA